MAHQPDFRPIAAATLSNAFLGATIVATRYVAVGADPLLLAFLRNAIAALTLLPLLSLVPVWRLEKGDRLPVIALGVAQFGVFPFTYTTALHYTPAARAALVFAMVPLLTLALSVLLRVEAFTRFKLGGALLALAGVALTLGHTAFFSEGGISSWTGEFFMLITVSIGACYNVLSRRYLLKYSARLLIVYFMASGALFLAPLAGLRGLAIGFPVFSLLEWGAVVFSGIFGGSLGYFLYVWALEKGTPARVAVFVPFNPITAAALAAWLLDEQLTLWFMLGLCCVVVGIVLSNFPPRRRLPEPTP